jgi:hypothetical protein
VKRNYNYVLFEICIYVIRKTFEIDVCLNDEYDDCGGDDDDQHYHHNSKLGNFAIANKKPQCNFFYEKGSYFLCKVVIKSN